MKPKAIYVGIFLSFIFILSSYPQKSEFPVLKGPYLGQKQPGMTPEIFAPGIVSTEKFREFSGTFTPDGKEYYFFRFADGGGFPVVFRGFLLSRCPGTAKMLCERPLWCAA